MPEAGDFTHSGTVFLRIEELFLTCSSISEGFDEQGKKLEDKLQRIL
ncbi:hypothetical protein H1S01_12425 [Heliobacterium chlorum]|uniref:Uncharacterized protein n=1 Tax=Heliobacterium chlorum TaxID=2698 RepID=A0ABR7T3G2_HELCL|nr:hypothetical protein [Heliobacterium chlorum]MBC9785315.1 hypothetical protein [Heliobacterium chlorum]